MDRLFWPLIILGFLPYTTSVKECLMEKCNTEYRSSMARGNIEGPERSHAFCEILRVYQKCIGDTAISCRGELSYHATEKVLKKLKENNCLFKPGLPPLKDTRTETQHNDSSATSSYPLPSCKYFGSKKFRHCGFFGDAHLKTFDAKYQTCRTSGYWNLIENPYMSVVISNKTGVEGESAIAPVKIVIVIKSSSTPCTLEKRYEADSENPLPSTFVDGTDRPGADETVSLKWKQDSKDYESVEIYMKYIATKLIIRRASKYLVFSASLPEEVIKSSATYNKEGKMELCTAGYPSEERLSIQSARKYMMNREQALNECKNMDKLEYDFKNNLTGTYLEWCVFDLMNIGLAYEFITVTHLAQLDALNIDPSSLQNRTEPSEWFSNSANTQSSNAGARITSISINTFILYFLLFSLNSLISLRCLIRV